MLEDGLWDDFQILARANGRSATKHLEWIMREALAQKKTLSFPVKNALDATPSGKNSSTTRKKSSG